MTAADRSHPPAPLPSEARPPSEARSAKEGSAKEGSARQGGASAAELRRLRWRARRGLLENDLLIGSFLERQANALNASDIDVLGRLLELPDPVLFELLLGRQRPVGALDVPAVRNMLARLGSNARSGISAGTDSN
jgi:antitoxin CptB